MYKKFVINVAEHETRVALLEDGTIAELFIERNDNADITGNVYKGRVQRVLPGMQAAFVDIGLQQAAFIYVDDIIGERFEEIEQLFLNSNGDGEEDAELAELRLSDPAACSPRVDCPIAELIKEGQEILVQVAKSPIGTKGARVTSYTSLPGRFLVLMPNTGHIGISRRIEDEKERDRLKNMVTSLRTENYGYIVRTAAESIQEEKLAFEMGFLNNLWNNIRETYARLRPRTGAPAQGVDRQPASRAGSDDP